MHSRVDDKGHTFTWCMLTCSAALRCMFTVIYVLGWAKCAQRSVATGALVPCPPGLARLSCGLQEDDKEAGDHTLSRRHHAETHCLEGWLAGSLLDPSAGSAGVAIDDRPTDGVAHRLPDCWTAYLSCWLVGFGPLLAWLVGARQAKSDITEVMMT